jgi:hypothetical protein
MKYLNYIILALLVVFCTSCQKSTEPIENDKPPPGLQKDIPWPSLADSPWPMHHGDPQSTGRSKYPGPMAGTIDWYVDSLYTYSGVSIGADKTIYFVSAGPPLLKGLFAVRPDGSTKWIIEEVASKFSETTPLVASDGTIYAAANTLYAINPDGMIKWKFNQPITIWQEGINIGLDGTVYFVSGSIVSIPAINAVNPDGSLKWKLEYPDLNASASSGIAFSPDGKTIYLPCTGPSLIAVDVENQNIKWIFGESWLLGTVTVDCQGHIYFQSQVDSINSGKASLFCLNPDGSVRWSFAHNNPRFRPTSCAEGTIDKNGNYYFAFDTLYSVDYDGNLRWKLGLADFSGGPLVCDINGNVYLPFGSSGYLAVSSDGDIIWQLYIDGWNGMSIALGLDQRMYIPTWKSEYVYSIK